MIKLIIITRLLKMIKLLHSIWEIYYPPFYLIDENLNSLQLILFDDCELQRFTVNTINEQVGIMLWRILPISKLRSLPYRCASQFEFENAN